MAPAKATALLKAKQGVPHMLDGDTMVILSEGTLMTKNKKRRRGKVGHIDCSSDSKMSPCDANSNIKEIRNTKRKQRLEDQTRQETLIASCQPRVTEDKIKKVKYGSGDSQRLNGQGLESQLVPTNADRVDTEHDKQLKLLRDEIIEKAKQMRTKRQRSADLPVLNDEHYMTEKRMASGVSLYEQNWQACQVTFPVLPYPAEYPRRERAKPIVPMKFEPTCHPDRPLFTQTLVSNDTSVLGSWWISIKQVLQESLETLMELFDDSVDRENYETESDAPAPTDEYSSLSEAIEEVTENIIIPSTSDRRGKAKLPASPQCSGARASQDKRDNRTEESDGDSTSTAYDFLLNLI